MTTSEVVNGIDWDLLEKQRETLAHVLTIPSFFLYRKEREHLEGVLNLLESLADAHDEEVGA